MADVLREERGRFSGTLKTANRGGLVLDLLLLVPFGLALYEAVRAPKIHVLLDFWHVFAKTTNEDGSLIFGQLFTYHLDQPFVVPSLLFWLDAAVFGGDNRVLTVLSVVLVALAVWLLGRLLPAGFSPVKRSVLRLGFAFLLLSSHAAELWEQGTNGASWLPALLFGLFALFFSSKEKHGFAYAAAALACLSFGAGLPIWFALALVAYLRGEHRKWVLIPAITGVVVIGFWFLTKPAGSQSLATSAFDPDGRLSVFAGALGGLWSVDVAVVAVLAGGVVAAGLLLMLTTSVRRPLPGEAPWQGLALYALMLAGMVALGRTTTAAPGGNIGLVSRYVEIAALATSALLVLVLLRRPGWPSRYVVTGVLALALITHAIGGGKLAQVRQSYAPLALTTFALKADAAPALAELQIQAAAVPAARALGMYPFTSGFTLGCGPELGAKVDLTQVGPAGSVTSGVDHPPVGGAVVSGWAAQAGKHAECVLLTDETGLVVGGGIVGLAATPAQVGATGEAPGWRAVAPSTTSQPVVLARFGGVLYRL